MRWRYIVARVVKGQNISSTFLETFQKVWKLSRNLDEIFCPVATLIASTKLYCVWLRSQYSTASSCLMIKL